MKLTAVMQQSRIVAALRVGSCKHDRNAFVKNRVSCCGMRGEGGTVVRWYGRRNMVPPATQQLGIRSPYHTTPQQTTPTRIATSKPTQLPLSHGVGAYIPFLAAQTRSVTAMSHIGLHPLAPNPSRTRMQKERKAGKHDQPCFSRGGRHRLPCMQRRRKESA